jgi:hypothetical protein
MCAELAGWSRGPNVFGRFGIRLGARQLERKLEAGSTITFNVGEG